MFRLCKTAALVLALAGAAVLVAVPARAADTLAYRALATQLVGELERVPVDRFPAASGYGLPSVAVRTANEAGDVSAADGAPEHTRHLIEALRAQSQGRFRFVALDSLDEVIAEIKAQNPGDDVPSDRIRSLRANAQADILIHGRVRTENGRETLSYDAVSMETGELLASTSAVAVPATTVTVAARPAYQVPEDGDTTPATIIAGYRPTVEETERLLFEKGYDPGPVDGVMTEETRRALTDYQRNSALPITGRMTRQTVDNLRRDTRVAL